MNRILSLLLTSTLFVPVLASESVTVELEKANNAQQKQARDEIIESGINPIFSELADSVFPFNNKLTIIYGQNDGPYYDSQQHAVFIPYDFYLQAKAYFAKNNYEKEHGRSAQYAALDTLMHTLLHEAGHAYVADQDIAILGKEEDAVDNFATVLLLEYVDKGSDVAISAADMFAYESEDKPEYYAMSEYAGEHSFDMQRYFATLCLVYGSNPEKFEYLLDEVESDYLDNRKDYCEFNYQQISNNWHRYLKVQE
ncbi:DUF4344 domain-containing metallopeptidase [Vibrio hannami]|uniref:DUF4344 domain-containing metallopeptidase n=1 Tax=Vibrio hannami TaxID=2717094 RepID=UPI00240F916E|nr:DUF4344 domain-containing metallopeptidase [Vibrio hannami]MDG3085120.1 DUF4344 domain-containing metallopeptidase [Vibrio hannami]